jgi:hypothetical protein
MRVGQLDEVRRYLHDAVDSTPESTAAERAPIRARLLARKAPFAVHLMWSGGCSARVSGRVPRLKCSFRDMTRPRRET